MKKIYYKCCRCSRVNSNGQPSSLIAHGKISVIYKMGQWVRPNVPGTKLMVFDSLESLTQFICYDDSCHSIYECHIINGTTNVPETFMSHVAVRRWGGEDRLFNILSRKKNKKQYRNAFKDFKSQYSSYGTHVPDGTVFCDAVQLINQITI